MMVRDDVIQIAGESCILSRRERDLLANAVLDKMHKEAGVKADGTMVKELFALHYKLQSYYQVILYTPS